MCVKEFLGYDCGHCSVPYLRLCPLAASNVVFPPCKFPAERPIFTNENCHPCSRIIWNTKVLKEEEVHRGQHQRGECGCEVIFDPEEREKRLRPRSGKGKGKGRGTSVGVGLGRGCADVKGGVEYNGSRVAGGDMYRAEGNVREHDGRVFHSSEQGGPSNTRQDWAPDAQMATYEYVGYFVDEQNHHRIDHQQGFAVQGSGVSGFVQQESTVWEGQAMLGQPGAGMKWYPQEVLPPLPRLPPLPPPLATRNFGGKLPAWQKAMSEPADRYEYRSLSEEVEIREVEDDVEKEAESQQPMIVRSDMGMAVSS